MVEPVHAVAVLMLVLLNLLSSSQYLLAIAFTAYDAMSDRFDPIKREQKLMEAFPGPRTVEPICLTGAGDTLRLLVPQTGLRSVSDPIGEADIEHLGSESQDMRGAFSGYSSPVLDSQFEASTTRPTARRPRRSAGDTRSIWPGRHP